ncbi:MAG: BrnT family toxin [Gemmatimonadetes bacterium]|nr:BrnT family toxin [Gemmatimonadota bacterium]MBK7784531.1 BrnT family toxin [Gemmatimonadota bacterium]MBK9067423.1 BrnT family toxin [Gemmatimonadota bacterium]
MTPGVTWDPAKRRSNLAKHGIDFVDAALVFEGLALHRPDLRRAYGEPRFVATGPVAGRLLVVVYSLRDATLRIISARRANARETKAYGSVRLEGPAGPDGLGAGGSADR